MGKFNIDTLPLFNFAIGFSRLFPRFTQWLRLKVEHDGLWPARKQILDYFEEHPEDIKDEEMREALSFIKKRGVNLYPYFWMLKYNPTKIKVYTDADCGLLYVLHEGKRLYFKRGTSPSRVKLVYNALIQEQDKNSPHTYQTDAFKISPDSIICDVGAAEGIFALTFVEGAKKIYLFETEEEWIEPLRKTFEPWKDKVTVIHKFASDKDANNSITLNSVLEPDVGNLFLKLDVEGAEKSVLLGASEALASDRFVTKAAVCTYHYNHDYEELKSLMADGYNYKVETSRGYMCCFYGTPPPSLFFRRTMIYCKK